MILLLMGGGLDSTSLLLHMYNNLNLRDFSALHIDYGQKAVLGELNSIKYFCNKYDINLIEICVPMNSFSSATILKNTEIGTEEHTNVLELRNLVLISIASSIVASNGGGCIYVGFHREEESTVFPDATGMFLDELENSIKLGTSFKIELSAPFRFFDREHVLKVGYGLDRDIIDKSYTCYEKPIDGKECGKCVHCITKKEIINKLEVSI